MQLSGYEALSQEENIGLEDHALSSVLHADDLEPITVKPTPYYGDGPFDPPSSPSVDEEADELLEKPHAASPDQSERSRAELQDDGQLVVGSRRRPSSLIFLVVSLVLLVGTAGVIGVFAARSYTGTPFRIQGTKHITMDHIFNGTFSTKCESILWVPEAGDGVFATQKGGYITLVDLKSNSSRNLVALADMKDEHGRRLSTSSWKLSADMRYMLLEADSVKLWRHSSYSNYYIHDLQTQSTWPLIPPTYPPVTAYASWSPTGQSIAYVVNNDLYMVTSPSVSAASIRVTTTGNASMFNGVPDWVYEEEVFSSNYAFWWSPDSKHLAFLTFDETAVDEFTYPIYNPTEDSYTVVPYPKQVTMKYPKPGYNNPLVQVFVFQLDEYLASTASNRTQAVRNASLELDWDRRLPADNSIISEVAWVANSTLVVREVNRAATNGTVVMFDLSSESRGRGHVVRRLGKDGEQGDGGWIESEQKIYPIPARLSPDGHASYLDIVPTADGYNHIALFSPVDSSTPRFLTSGDWEVTGSILAVDAKRSLVYFQAANPGSLQRHIYSVPLPAISSSGAVEPSALTDTSSPAVYEADFSPKGGFYLLSYNGPQAPWQKVIESGGDGLEYVLTDNPQVNETLNRFEMPVVTHSTIESDDYELNFVEIRPPRMDDTGRTKYPVLFRVYGGPGSQLVSLSYTHDWHDFVACSLQYIVVTVDGRGTGYKGRKLRNAVKDNLGYWETQDQINAAKIWAAKEYVDPDRIGIWGWSYGGFMSSKVIEANAGIHSLAIAVAPVTSWRLYDSIYTERYMDLPVVNPEGYVTASISNVTGFHDVDFLLAHGSGDDNVHFANSAHLIDMFTREHVRDFEFRMFTDSDHSITRRDANRELYEFMTAFLIERWGKGGKRRSW
ncbi:dipeptidyl aminopeptidase [Laetiporus sulphureus 93-53]|uniref:Dipeptidyl aminopeptidase n=1 Tax=Laetiporus sulphureus 93-53 TaxID=1314785 RepID=A0A165EJB5_9APHY|nr:dipeptidyl aminopeptidase [Laetiporus sulphureus 93-53]KZT07170.1 dipeptidyl aminopeptidase [Laetiporus sulphureus 93-53]